MIFILKFLQYSLSTKWTMESYTTWKTLYKGIKVKEYQHFVILYGFHRKIKFRRDDIGITL
jgi:hypothetical protein